MIVTDDDQAAAMMSALRNQGRAPGDTWLQHTYLGYNYRLDEMSAALGRVQMSRLEELLAKRRAGGRLVCGAPGRDPRRGSAPPGCRPPAGRAGSCMWSALQPASTVTRSPRRLGEAGIPARPYFLPIHLQPYMVERFGYQPGDFPVTEDLGQRGLALPFSGVMSESEVDLVCQELRAVIDRVTDWMRALSAVHADHTQDVKTTSSLPASLSWMRLTTISMCRDSCTKSRSSVRMVSTGQTSKVCSQSS